MLPRNEAPGARHRSGLSFARSPQGPLSGLLSRAWFKPKTRLLAASLIYVGSRVMLVGGVSDLIVVECFVTTVAIGLVVAVFALAQVVVLAFGAFKSLRCKLAALMRTIAEGLFLALAAGAKKVFFVFFKRDFGWAVVSDYGVCH